MPSARAISPSGDFMGDDGQWSTFAVQVGSNNQLVKVLPATSGSSLWVINPQGCPQPTDQTLYTTPDNCNETRGGIFVYEESNTFDRILSPSNQPYLGLPFDSLSALNYSGNAVVGQDSFCFGTECNDAPLLKDQIVASYAAKVPWLGVIGISGRPEHVRTTQDQDKSALQTLKDDGAIAGLYYGYQAGAYYRNDPQQFASLTLGGYDSLRGSPEAGLRFPFNSQNSDRDLQVSIQSITIGSGSTSTKVDGLGIASMINSLVPEIWLPPAACKSFEDAFGIQWNDTSQTYFVSEAQHDTMRNLNKSVEFVLGVSPTEPPNVTVTLPYAAFDQYLEFPNAGLSAVQGQNNTQVLYFPLKQASSPDQYFLGRTFLQEAYLMVDYDKQEFFVSQANFPNPPSQTKLVNAGGSGGGGSSALSTGAIAGIAVGAAALILIVAAIFFWRWRRNRRIRKLKAELQVASRGSIGGTTIQDEDQHNIEFFKPSSPAEEEVKPELDGSSAIPAGFVQYGRHELASNGSVRRTSQQSGLSRGTISPISGRMPSHARNLSYGSSNGQPSPSAGDSPSPGQGAWGASPHGSPDPEMREVRHQSGGQWYFELPANPRSSQSPRPALDVIQSANAAPAQPVEVRADPRSPTEPDSASRFREDLRE
ncbi:hypothetical protein HII31_12014 [Pseudocercospora fuligena]|uniref:Peptidase A1 domain-containing protein n=1 Tax=Pseudocercospora fuligena TaxID=685502 RepID=A0A8H6VH34_9PEZI|nr:hypothetical protein HII31_12014 [Pseudocercospora fuligena]